MFDRISGVLTGQAGEPDMIMIDSKHLNPPRPRALKQWHVLPSYRADQGWPERQSVHRLGVRFDLFSSRDRLRDHSGEAIRAAEILVRGVPCARG